MVAGFAELPGWLLADGGYDCKAFREELQAKGIEPVSPYRKTAKNHQPVDWHLYKERHAVECFFNKLKNYRAVAYRTCKTLLSYQGFVALACYIMWHRLLGNKI